MAQAIVQFALAAAIVIVTGGVLARAAERIAVCSGLGRLLVGSILLAGATSLPELSVDISAVRAGLDDVAVGDLLGSSLFNLLILAIADLVHARRGEVLTRTSQAHALQGLLAIALTALVGMMIAIGPTGLPSLGGIGLGSASVALAYLLGVRLVYRDQRIRNGAGQAPAETHASTEPVRMGLAGPVLLFAIASAAMLLAAPFVAHSAGEIAELSGLGGTFVGTTLVAASTSLPELVATIAAVRMGSFDLAVGNVFGSNTFNMAMLLPIDVFSDGPLLGSVSATHALTAFWVVIVTSVALMSIVYHDPRRRRFIEPDAVAIILLVVAALVSVFLARG